jgi:beta-mannosidase
MKSQNNRVLADLNGSWNMAFCPNAERKIFTTIEAIHNSGLIRYPAQVPGNFELDLHAAGVIPDPLVGLNMLELQNYETCDIWYFRHFPVEIPSEMAAELVFEGLDCIADIYVNGSLAGSTDNMLIPHRLDVSHLLREENQIVVHIKPAVTAAQAYDYPAFLSAFSIGFESLYIRKAPHMFGWDIMPRAVSAGIWRDVSLQAVPAEGWRELYLHTLELSDRGETARLRLTYSARAVEFYRERWEIEITGQCGEHSFQEKRRIFFSSGQIAFQVHQPRLWWPKGRGEPNLYRVSVSLFKNGKAVDEADFNFGIRTIRLERTSTTDEEGRGEFCFWVNGERVFIKGTNWVPLDTFHSRDLQRLELVFPLLLEVNCNMVRCWGGNVYESDRFYDLCDENGILVWQDFAMACAMYPQDDAFSHRLGEEVRQVVRRLRQHTCIALWSGDNECDAAYRYVYRTDPNANVLTRKIIPDVLRNEDPFRPYLPSSPYIDSAAYQKGERYLPENHLWGPRDYYKSDFYRNALCHFASEIGYHGCPNPSSIRRFISPDKVWPYQDNDEWQVHSTAPVPESGLFNDRLDLMARQVAELFGEIPDNLEDFAFASQVSQAEAKKFFVELFRAQKWRKTGIIWWNLVDGWPQFSDAVVDYYFEKKLAFDFIRSSQADLCLVLAEAHNWQQSLLAVNDLKVDVPLIYSVYDVDIRRAIASGSATAHADAVTSLASLPFRHSDKGFYLLHWKWSGGSGFNHYLKGAPPFRLAQYRDWFASFTSLRQEILQEEGSVSV